MGQELLVRLVPLPPITYNFYLRKLRFLRKVRKSMSLKMILNPPLSPHVIFISHEFLRLSVFSFHLSVSRGL